MSRPFGLLVLTVMTPVTPRSRTIIRHYYNRKLWNLEGLLHAGAWPGRITLPYNVHGHTIRAYRQRRRQRDRGAVETVRWGVECFRAVRFGASQHIAAQACRLRATCIRMNAALRRSSCAHSHRTPPRRCCRGCGHIFERRRRTGYRAGWRTTSRAHARDRTRAAWCGR